MLFYVMRLVQAGAALLLPVLLLVAGADRAGAGGGGVGHRAGPPGAGRGGTAQPAVQSSQPSRTGDPTSVSPVRSE